MSFRFTARTAVAVGTAAVAAAASALMGLSSSASALAPNQLAYDTTGSTTLTNPNSNVTVNFKPTVMTVTLLKSGAGISANLPLAPVKAGFKAYGFLPSTGTVVFTQVKPITGTLDLSSSPYHVTAAAQYVVSLRDVTIGGAKANVGPNCQTIKPVQVAVTDGGDFNLFSGTLNGVYDLGRFTNCGAAQQIINNTLPGTANTLTLHIQFPDSSPAAAKAAFAKAARA